MVFNGLIQSVQILIEAFLTFSLQTRHLSKLKTEDRHETQR